MAGKKAIAIFDIGKTNKKLLLFDEDLKLVFQEEEIFKTTLDDDGFECDDIKLIAEWVISSLSQLVRNSKFSIKAVNFSTYGASLVFLDAQGKRLTPLYNYLKEVSSEIENELFEKYGGKKEFCRKTASPASGVLLNSGIQILWLKKTKAHIFKKVNSILHFPQYLSYLLTGELVSEATCIGCHTFLWDFDQNRYHAWLGDEGIELPRIHPNSQIFPADIAGYKLNAGVGIHDSTASLVPYMKASKEKFLLISTGTWWVNMNPFNQTPLNDEQLAKDCLSFRDANQQTIKSSRLFLGHIHDVNTEYISEFFHVPPDTFKTIKADSKLLKNYLLSEGYNKLFFKNGIPLEYIDKSVNLSQFSDFREAYNRLIFDLSLMNKEAIELVLSENDQVNTIYISGGFARNEIFVKLLASFFPVKTVFTSDIDNSSALGAALAIWETSEINTNPEIDLALKKWSPLE